MRTRMNRKKDDMKDINLRISFVTLGRIPSYKALGAIDYRYTISAVLFPLFLSIELKKYIERRI